MNDKVTVIVPVYNVEQYIIRCLDSIIYQSYKNLEIILVDDGSTDNSGKICDDYARKDDRIIVIHKINGGLSSARNAALDIFSGEYVCFVDSDDYIDQNMIYSLLNYIKSDDFDFVQFGYSFIKENTPIKKWSFKQMILDSQENIFNIYFKTSNLNEILWNKFYKASIFKEIRMIEGKNNEDYIIMPKILKCVKKILIIEKCYYNYFIRENSITNLKFTKKKMDRLYAGEYVVDFCDKEIIDYVIYARINLCFICIYLNSDLLDSKINKSEKISYYNIIKHSYRENFFMINNQKDFKELSFIKRLFLILGIINLNIPSRIYKIYLKYKLTKEK